MTRTTLTALLALLLLPLTGCAGFGAGGSGGSGVLLAETNPTQLSLRLPSRAADVQDTNTADVYLTDLSPATIDRLGRGEITPETSGTLVHVHVFLSPKPGRTPIEPTAASATARVVVVARGQVGVYDGAGFMLPGKSLTKGKAAGHIQDAPTRLTRATPGFTDLLDSARLELNFNARHDPATSDSIARAVRVLSAAADPVER